MKRAQMLSDSMAKSSKVQASLQKGNDILNQQKAKHPDELKDVQMSDSINPKTPSVDAITTEMNNAASALQNYNRQTDQSIPKRDISKNANKIVRLSKKNLVEMAQYESNKVKPNLSFNEKDTLNLLMKDTGNNLAGIGVFVLSSGGSKNAAAYLICQGVIRRPSNKWSANDMGVLFRSLQCMNRHCNVFFMPAVWMRANLL
jgi:hypothetical protein